MEMFDEKNQYVSLANKYRPQKFEDMVARKSSKIWWGRKAFPKRFKTR